MQLYARPGRRMARQVGGDLGVLALLALFALAGRMMARLVDELAFPARRTAAAAADMSEQMHQAQESIGVIPGVGAQLSDPFGSMATGLQEVASQAESQVQMVHQVATATGLALFLVPTVVVLWRWLPSRVRFVRQAAAARQLVDADEDLELFALRAMAHQPMERLARITPDPVGALRRGERDVVRQLAALELRDTGLGMPRPVPSPRGVAR